MKRGIRGRRAGNDKKVRRAKGREWKRERRRTREDRKTQLLILNSTESLPSAVF